MRWLLAIPLVLLTAPAQAQTTIHVPRDQPTIQAGVDAAVDGDTVLVAPGVYVENVLVSGKSIELRAGLGPMVTVIDGGDVDSCVRLHAGADGSLEGFTLTNGYGNSAGGGLQILDSSPLVTGCRIENNWALSDGGGVLVGNGAPRITNCVVRANETLYWDGGGMILSLAQGTVITHCTIVDNVAAVDGWGGGIWDITGGVTISNCIIKNNEASWTEWDLGVPSTTRVQHCCFSESQGTHGNIDADPLFVDQAAGDVHLRADSPCRDAGMAGAPAAPWLDPDGNPRGAVSDMGADEFGPAAYLVGPLIPGQAVLARAGGGAPGDAAQLWLDADLRNAPLVTPLGEWWLAARRVKVLAGTLDAQGWTKAAWIVPTSTGGVLYTQGVVGAAVTPVAVAAD